MQDDICMWCKSTIQPDGKFIIFNDGDRLCIKCEDKLIKVVKHCLIKLQKEKGNV